MSCETTIRYLRTKVPLAMNLSEPQNVLVCVDWTQRSRVAVRYACRHAKKTGGNVSLLHVIEPPEFQHWNAVGDAMKEECRTEAEALLGDPMAVSQDIINSSNHSTRPRLARRCLASS